MATTSERPPKGHAQEAAEQAAVSASEAYKGVEQSILGMFGVMDDPDQRVELLADIWTSAPFASLSQSEQEALRVRYGTGKVVEAPKPVAEAPKEAAPQAEQPATKMPERRENGKLPLKRVFKQYRIAHDGINDKLVIVEDVDVYDDVKKAYEPKQGITTKIGIPESLQGRIMTEPEIGQAVVEAAAEVRTKLDENGLKLFLDEARWEIPAEQAKNERSAVVNADNTVKRLYLKWKYKIDDTQHARDFLDLSEVPADILKLLKEDKDYWKRPEWKKWFGVQMQKKREEIITEKILEAIGQGKGEKLGPDMDVQSSVEIEDAEEVVEAPKPEVVQPAVTPVAPPKAEVAPTPAQAPTPKVEAPKPAPAAPKADAAPAAPAPTPTAPEAPKTPEAPKEVSAEQLREDVQNEVRRNVAPYRKAYGDDIEGLANRVIGASFVLLTEKYALAKQPVEAERLFNAIKDATVTELGMTKPEEPKPAETPAPTPEAETSNEREEFEEQGKLANILHGLTTRALEGTDATPTEIAVIADSVAELLQKGKSIKFIGYEPGKRLVVVNRTGLFERIRALHIGIRAQNGK